MEPRNENLQELIDRFFEGRLSAKDKAKFKEHLKDPKFRTSFELQKTMAKSLKRETQNPELKRLFQEREKKIVQRITLRRRLAIAASILILLTAGWYVLSDTSNPQRPVASNELDLNAVANFQKDPIEFTRKSGTDEDPTNDPNATCKDYYEDDYEKTLNCFLEMEKQGPINLEAHYFIGSCYLKLKQYPQALSRLSELANNQDLEPDSKEGTQIAWNYLLAQILTSENPTNYIDDINQLLENNPDYKYAPEAKDLRDLLSSSVE